MLQELESSDHIEDRIVGIKSREIYEAPAATCIIEAHRDLEKILHTSDESTWKFREYHSSDAHCLQKTDEYYAAKSSISFVILHDSVSAPSATFVLNPPDDFLYIAATICSPTVMTRMSRGGRFIISCR